jgi:hypothetical protein
MRIMSCIVLAASLLTSQTGCKKVVFPDFMTADEKEFMKAVPCFPEHPKGGIGIINTELSVVTKPTRNELLFDSRENWIGHSASTPEVVIVFDGKVWTSESLPHGFDKSKSVVVSFDENKISFYDYIHKSGGYYGRSNEN